VKVHWIGEEKDISSISILLNEPFIGFDSEMRLAYTAL